MRFTMTRAVSRSEEHTSELQSRQYLVCRLLLEKKPVRQPTVIRPIASPSKLPHRHGKRWSSTGSILLFFNDTATTEIYTLSLHDALPICALAHSPRALLLDEPFSALDPDLR